MNINSDSPSSMENCIQNCTLLLYSVPWCKIIYLKGAFHRIIILSIDEQFEMYSDSPSSIVNCMLNCTLLLYSVPWCKIIYLKWTSHKHIQTLFIYILHLSLRLSLKHTFKDSYKREMLKSWFIEIGYKRKK